MKTPKITLTIAAALLCGSLVAQVQLNKSLQLTGSGSDAKVEGVDEVINNHDAANKIYVDTAIANRAGGGTSTMNLSLSVNPSSAIVPVGHDNADSPLLVRSTYTSGLSNNILYSTTGVPADVYTRLTPGTCTPNCESDLTFSVGSSATPGIYNITVTATGGASVQTSNVTLTIPNAKRVFVTSSMPDGNLGGLSGADNECQTLADAQSLGGTWQAWLSTPSVNAIDRVPTGVAFARMDGQLIANDIADLTDGTLINPIELDETGNPPGGSNYAFTGSTDEGILNTSVYPGYLSAHCNSWTCACTGGSTHLGGVGQIAASDSTWSQHEAVVGYGCSNPTHLYCFEQ